MKLRKIIILLVLVLISGLNACDLKTGKQETAPSNILTEDQLAEVLADFALSESAANLNIKNVGLPAMDTVYAFDPLKFNNIRKSQYDSTIRYYSEHPKLYKSVYEKTLTKLTELESRTSARIDSVSK